MECHTKFQNLSRINCFSAAPRGSIPLASTRVKMSGYSRSFLFCLKALGLKGFEEMRTAEEKGGMCMIIQRKREKNGL